MRTLYLLAGIVALLAAYEIAARFSIEKQSNTDNEARKMRLVRLGREGWVD